MEEKRATKRLRRRIYHGLKTLGLGPAVELCRRRDAPAVIYHHVMNRWQRYWADRQARRDQHILAMAERSVTLTRHTLAEAERLAAAGEHATAARTLHDLIRTHWPVLRGDIDLLIRTFGTAIVAEDFATASTICNRFCDSGDWFGVSVYVDATIDIEVLKWNIESKSRCRILLNDIYGHPEVDAPLRKHALIKRFFETLPLLAAYRDAEGLTTGSVLINIGDFGRVPGLVFSENRPDYFLVPDINFLATLGYRKARHVDPYQIVPWSARAPVALWRGATTGMVEREIPEWRSLPRVVLCQIGLQHPDLIDAGITDIVQVHDAQDIADIQRTVPIKPFSDSTRFSEFKYQIDIDGNSNSWPGLFLKLLTGSPVLKVASQCGYRQWYYDRLLPWVNFVPVQADMSDLIEKIRWLRQHDGTAQEIGRAGHALAMSLQYETELVAAGRTITDAIRHVSSSAQARETSPSRYHFTQ